jgi:hypothetical protein
MKKLIVTISLVVAIITMVAPNQLSIYASPTTEDDGWVEGDYEGNSEEQEEQAQEDWEDAGRPGEIEDDDDDENDDDDNNSEDELIECEDGSLVETEDLCEQSEARVQCSDGSYAATLDECPIVSNLITCSDGSSVATLAECPSLPTSAQEQFQTCQNGSVVSLYERCPEPEPEPLPEEQLKCPDGSVVSINEACPSIDKPLPDCDGSFQDCISQDGFVCPAGSTAHECELPEPVSREMPDNDCLFNTELPKCAPVDGKCPDGFGTNEDGRCFVIHNKCPDGYHTTEDDETGECNTNSECTGEGYVLVNNGQSCREKKTWCLENLGADECNKKEEKKWWECDVPWYMTCDKQIKKNGNKDTTKVIQKTTVIDRSSATATAASTANIAEESNCRLDGSADGIQQKFDSIKYQACGLYTNAQKAYSDGFVLGCTQIGNTQLICQSLVDSSILNVNTQPTKTSAQPTQTQTQTQTQPTPGIQPALIGG